VHYAFRHILIQTTVSLLLNSIRLLMKYSSFFLLFFIFLSSQVFSQVREEGTRTETDSATGQTKTVTYVETKHEEDITPRTNMIVVNPLKFFLFYNLSYYHAFSQSVAAGAGAQMPTPSGIGGFGLNAEVRWYPSKKALRGFYVAPNISYNHLSSTFSDFDETDTDVSADVTSVGALLGWQWFIGDDFAIGLGIGYDHYFLSGDDNGDSFLSFDGGAPALRFDIGYAWE
jgi:hypothetical protein